MSQSRPYHHGDLRRALIGAARQLLEVEGEGALSLRAAAREAGVSPAAPYHHFKDKEELLTAVADEGYGELIDDLRTASVGAAPGKTRLTAMGAAYAAFALRRRALYQIMTRIGRTRDRSREGAAVAPGAEVARLMREAVAESLAPDASERDIHLAGIAAWAAIHGLADLAAFPMLAPLKEELGGEQPFLRSVLDHLAVFAGRPGD